MGEDPQLLPLFPLGTALVPGMVMPLHLFEPRYRLLAERLAANPDRPRFGVVGIRAGREVGDDVSDSLYPVGTVAEVTSMTTNEDGTVDLESVGTARFSIVEIDRTLPYLQAQVVFTPESDGEAPDEAALEARRMFGEYRDVLGLNVDPATMNPQLLSYVITATVVAEPAVKQRLLAAPDTTERLYRATDLLRRELGIIKALASLPATDLMRWKISTN